MKRVSAVFLFLISFVCVSQEKQLPSFIHKCKRNDPELNDCMKNALLDFRKYLTDGVRELKIPSLNPYILPKSTFQTSWMNTTFTDMKTYNGDKYRIDFINVDLDNGIITMNFTVADIRIQSHYILDGHISQFNLHGEGEMEANMSDTIIASVMHGKIIQKKGHEYLNLQDVDYKIINEPLERFYLHDLFKNNPELTKRVHEVLWENQSELGKEMYPLVEKIVSSIYLSLFKALFDHFPLDELFD